MEKLVYVLWRGDRDAVDVPGNLHEVTAPALMEAGARFVKMSVVDDAVAAGEALRIGSQPADKDAVVSFWLEESSQRGDCEAISAAAAPSIISLLIRPRIPWARPDFNNSLASSDEYRSSSVSIGRSKRSSSPMKPVT